jgi:ATP-dependent Clp protease ATP-binding subunit ClpC
MFERYTEKARRVIFFARCEASQFGSPSIETEHLLLGLLREDKALSNRFLQSRGSVESIGRQIHQHAPVREKVSTSVDLPLSDEGKRVLAYAAEEAERLSHQHIGTEHLLLGLLREEKSLASRLLHEQGLKLLAVREELQKTAHMKPEDQVRPRGSGSPAIQTTLGSFQLALNVAHLAASFAFYSKLGFVAVAGEQTDRAIVMQNGLCRIALYQGYIAENRLNFPQR